MHSPWRPAVPDTHRSPKTDKISAPARTTMPRCLCTHRRRIAVAIQLAAACCLPIALGPTTPKQPRESKSISRAVLAAGVGLRAQTNLKTGLAKGKILVAAETLGDPNFAKTVVLLTDYNEDGSMGIILNRATGVKLSELLPRIESLKQRDDPIYEGGPVERAEILMLVDSAEEPEHSQRVFDHVYLSASADLLKRLARETERQNTPFRVYSGYAGWAPGQLEAEVEVGAWHIFPATRTMIFATRPEDLWPDLIRRTTLRLALTRPVNATVGSCCRSRNPARLTSPSGSRHRSPDHSVPVHS